MTKIYRKPELCSLLGVSPTTLWRWVQDKSFPAPIHLGPNSVGWLESDIDDWLTQKGQHQGGV
jgi:prophage regulatory protein